MVTSADCEAPHKSNAWGVTCLGCALRSVLLATLDQTQLNLNISNFDFSQLLHPLCIWLQITSSMEASGGGAASTPAASGQQATTKVADLLRFWNPEFLQHQLEHASVMDELPAVKVSLHRVLPTAKNADDNYAEIDLIRSCPRMLAELLCWAH